MTYLSLPVSRDKGSTHKIRLPPPGTRPFWIRRLSREEGTSTDVLSVPGVSIVGCSRSVSHYKLNALKGNLN